jgi:hypothetical protein
MRSALCASARHLHKDEPFLPVPGTSMKMKGACGLQSSSFSLLECVVHVT